MAPRAGTGAWQRPTSRPGDEPLRRTEIVAAIRDAALAGGHAEKVVLYADPGFDWQALRHHLDSPSLFSATRLIELRLGESGPGVQGSVACAERPPMGDVVLITASGLDSKARQSAWYRALDKAGVVIETRPVSPAMLPRWTMERARRLGPTLEHEAATFLSERVENNPLAGRSEHRETRGPASRSPGWPSRSCRARSPTTAATTPSIWSRRPFAGRLDQSLKVLRGLREEAAEPVMILWATCAPRAQLAQAGLEGVAAGVFAEHHPVGVPTDDLADKKHEIYDEDLPALVTETSLATMCKVV